MINDQEMLTAITETTDMARDALGGIVNKIENADLKTIVNQQIQNYDSVYNSARVLMEKYHENPKKANPVAKLNANFTAKMKAITAENVNSVVAEMAVQGTTMGITELTKKLHEYDCTNKEIVKLAEKHIKHEEENVKILKEYL